MGMKTTTTLTARQSEILEYIRSEIAEKSVAPSTREIQRHFGFSSQTAAVQHIRALEAKGAIARHPGKARAIYIPGNTPQRPAVPNHVKLLLFSLISY